jgi:hypothetical protein
LGLKGSILFLEIVYFFKLLGEQRSCDGRGRAAPIWRVYELKRTGARSAQARTRGQNPLVPYNPPSWYISSNVDVHIDHIFFFLYYTTIISILRLSATLKFEKKK